MEETTWQKAEAAFNGYASSVQRSEKAIPEIISQGADKYLNTAKGIVNSMTHAKK